MSATLHFSIKYDGPALASHQMDVRELAPALIALSNLLEESNRELYPNAPEIRVNVHGNFKSGSFGIDLVALQSVKDQLLSLLTGPEASALSNLSGILQLLGLLGMGAGLVQLLKWLKGRKPSKIRVEGDKVVFELLLTEQIETLELDLAVGRLYQSRVVRQALAKVIKPLESDGIDTFACGQDGHAQALVTKDEAAYFDVNSDDADVVSDITSSGVLLQIESAVFKEGNKWRFHDGSNSFFAEIADATFLSRIESGAERFGKGDVLVVDLRRIQSITDNGLKSEFVITRVIEHRAPLQTSLRLS